VGAVRLVDWQHLGFLVWVGALNEAAGGIIKRPEIRGRCWRGVKQGNAQQNKHQTPEKHEGQAIAPRFDHRLIM
jgi:hypothetical protein